ncbi:MAG: hypothetical protein JNN01_08725 [Opitutaceae bacterium]|nr:hypothetical protein [Opitutaceae bacterium]
MASSSKKSFVGGWIRRLQAVGLSLLLLGPAIVVPAAPPTLPAFTFHEVLPGTRAAAEAGAVSLAPVVVAETPRGLVVGDGLTALVTWVEGKAVKQWLVQVAATDLNQKESKLPPARGMRLFSSTGHEFRFAGSRAALAMRVLGPFEQGKAPTREAREGKRVRVLTQSEYLGLGLDRSCQVIQRLQAARTQAAKEGGAPAEQQSLGFGGQPFPPDVVAAAQKRAAIHGLTVDDERALIGALPALLEFFSIVSRTPGLQDILMSVIDVPWWSILKSGGKVPDIGIEFVSAAVRKMEPGPWLLPDLTPYTLPFVINLNKKPALVCHLAVVAPRAPLVAAAGIVGVAAGRPDGKGPRLMIQVVASQPAPTPAAPVVPEATAAAPSVPLSP